MGIPLSGSMASQTSPDTWRMAVDLAEKRSATTNCECYALVYVQYASNTGEFL